MDFSVIVCTYNRANLLPRCLNALARQRGVDSLNWEVLVVDNNSTDKTRSAVASLAAELPINIRYSWEGQQGLNHARNTGIRETQSTYFAYVDDDIAVSPFWLQSLHQRFVKDDADAVGGRIHLDPSIVLPKWIKDDETKGFLGYQDYGDQPFRMDGKKRYPFGGNMAFNRRVVDRIGYFNPCLGARGKAVNAVSYSKAQRRIIFTVCRLSMMHEYITNQTQLSIITSSHFNCKSDILSQSIPMQVMTALITTTENMSVPYSAYLAIFILCLLPMSSLI